MTSQVGLIFYQYLHVLCNPDIIGQNQVKLGTVIKQDEKTRKIFFCHSNMLGSNPFLLFLKYRLLVRLLWSKIVLEVSVHKGSKRNSIMSLQGSRKWDTFVSK